MFYRVLLFLSILTIGSSFLFVYKIFVVLFAFDFFYRN